MSLERDGKNYYVVARRIHKVKLMKRVLACALAVMLAVPSISSVAAEQNPAAIEETEELQPEASEPAETSEPTETSEVSELQTETPEPTEPQTETTELSGTQTETVELTETQTETTEPANLEAAETVAEEEDAEEKSQEETVPAAENNILPQEAEVDTKASGTESQETETPEEDTETGEAIQTELDEVKFNTGNHAWSVVNREAFDAGLGGDICFEEDGSYTINIPEANPFFPYEVQFTHDGETVNEWFMSPDDNVEVGGHTFYVSAYMDGTALTQLSLEVGGKTVVVYPEAKEFTDDEEGGIAPASLIPLTSVSLDSVDLTGYTPIELTMISVNAVLGDKVESGSKISWKQYNDSNDAYTVTASDGVFDLSGGSGRWEMIVGDGDQLNPDNIRYSVYVYTTSASDWLTTADVYAQDGAGARSAVTVLDSYYSEYRDTEAGRLDVSRRMTTTLSVKETEGKTVYASLKTDGTNYADSRLSSLKVVEGHYETAEEAAAALASKDVTASVLCTDMTQTMAGYQIDYTYYDNPYELTMIAYDASGTIIGYMSFDWNIYGEENYVYLQLYDKTESDNTQLDSVYVYEGRSSNRTFYIDESYALNGSYTMVMSYEKNAGGQYSDITNVYAGQYASIAEAEAAGAANIKDRVVGTVDSVEGYTADYSQGIWFSVFAGADSDANQASYTFCVKTRNYTTSDDPYLQSGSYIYFYNTLIAKTGERIPCYVVSDTDDSYAEKNFITILVAEDVDLSKEYAPTFDLSKNAKAYAAGSSSEEVSGESFHCFAEPVQYTVSAENGTNYKNYWVQIKKVDADSQYPLYISSLEDPDAETVKENGVIYSTREIMLDSYHNYVHDICLVNMGTKALPKLSVELTSDVVELDEYWTLSGNQDLQGMSTVETPSYSSDLEGELPNLAKLRLRAKDGVENGTDISGKLTIKSDGKILMVLTLTGVVGDPCIITDELPDAVKYVPYGTMIQNSSKYSWIQASYELVSGTLPEGMQIKTNGELYGVPRESGSFTFVVEVTFTSNRESYRFPNAEAELTLTVKENTNANVYNETDTEYGYSLETPIGVETTPGSYDFYLANKSDTLFVSEGLYNEFIDLWLNGEKLERGVDYTAESGSTRITVSSQTLKNKAAQTGNNTIAAEFRVDGDMDKDLRRTAQNFHLDKTSSGSGSGSSSGSSSGSGSGGSSSDEESTGGSGGSTAPAVVTISGRLVDADNHPLAGMTVELHSTPRVTTTDANGNFLFTDVEFGQHQLFVKDANGTVLASKAFEIWENSTVSLNGDVFNAPRGTTISVTVRLADGALAFSNVVFTSAPATGDVSDPASWMLLALVSCAALAGAVIYKRRTAMHR